MPDSPIPLPPGKHYLTPASPGELAVSTRFPHTFSPLPPSLISFPQNSLPSHIPSRTTLLPAEKEEKESSSVCYSHFMHIHGALVQSPSQRSLPPCRSFPSLKMVSAGARKRSVSNPKPSIALKRPAMAIQSYPALSPVAKAVPAIPVGGLWHGGPKIQKP